MKKINNCLKTRARHFLYIDAVAVKKNKKFIFDISSVPRFVADYKLNNFATAQIHLFFKDRPAASYIITNILAKRKSRILIVFDDLCAFPLDTEFVRQIDDLRSKDKVEIYLPSKQLKLTADSPEDDLNVWSNLIFKKGQNND